MQYFELSLLTLNGLVIGSFVNVCVDRLTLKYANKEALLNFLETYDIPAFLKKQILNRSLSIFNPVRSFCFACGNQIKWYENIPVFSYFLCKGMCQKCKALIGSKSIWTEIIHGFSYFSIGFFLDNLIYALLICISFSFFWFLGNFFF